MIRKHGSALRALLMMADAAIAAALVIAIYHVRFLLFEGSPAPDLFTPAWAPVALYAGAWVILLYVGGAYRLRAHWSFGGEARAIVGVTMRLAVLVFAALFVTNLDEVSRSFVLALLPIQAVVTIATRVVIRAVFMFVRRQGRNARYMLIVGTDARALDFARTVETHGVLGVRILGLVGREPPRTPTHWAYLGDLEDLEGVLRTHVVDEVAICLPIDDHLAADDIVHLCQEQGIIMRIPLNIPQLGAGRRIIEEIEGFPVLSLVKGPDHALALAVKRLIDLAGASIGLIILSPLLLAVAISIRWKEGGPVLFRQVRVGLHGRQFRIVKFRTMERDAEERFGQLAPLSDTRGPAFKMVADPRVTPWGRHLRRLKLDELPQLWNVLKGEMSLVGPRPAPPREVDVYDVWHRRRLSMKPGMTGLWQVSSRLDEHFDQRATFDLDYIDRWSLWLDLQIAARTVPVILRGGH